MRFRRLSAFTLIEMLLVVAILSLLISIVLPTMAQTRQVTKNSVCASNLRLIHSATVSYTVSNRAIIPASRAWVGGNFADINSVRNGTLYSYMGKNESAYICPLFMETPRSWWTSNYGGKNYQTYTTIAFTYSLNEYAGSHDWNGKPGLRSFNRADEPNKLHLYSDENPWTIPTLSNHPINNGAMGVGKYGPTNTGSIIDSLGSFHSPNGGNLDDGSSTVVFFDGHTELVHVSQSKEVVTPRRYK